MKETRNGENCTDQLQIWKYASSMLEHIAAFRDMTIGITKGLTRTNREKLSSEIFFQFFNILTSTSLLLYSKIGFKPYFEEF